MNFSKIGLIANELSKQAKLRIGSFIEPSYGLGSKIKVNLFSCGVATAVENDATVVKAKNLPIQIIIS